MPIYEFRCNSCQRKSSLFLRGVGSSLTLSCPTCGSGDLVRLVSSFAVLRPQAATLDDLRDIPDKPDLNYYSDPRNIGRWTEKRAKDLGWELPPEIKESIEKARSGQLPDEIKELGKSF